MKSQTRKACRDCGNKNTIQDLRPGWCSKSSGNQSGLLGVRFLRCEDMRVSHATVDDDVLLPLHRALGELLLRLDDLLHERRAHLLVDDLVVDFELLLQDRSGRLVELDLVL